MEFDLELDNVLKEIKKVKPKTVCIQLPDGLKYKANEIIEYLETNSNAKIFIWLGSCFGSCDLPPIKPDLLVQFGHSPWVK
jgi:diphthamide biosynthesis enzyme Dph1/Dph2-like protein